MRETASELAKGFVSRLADLCFDDAFNPYRDVCPDHDLPDAPMRRRQNFQVILESALTNGVDSLWVARDLGYRGGRRTGLALTDETHLQSHAELLRTGGLSRATKGPPMSERTATIVWTMLHSIGQPIFLFNVFPLHPHLAGDSLSNRSHTRKEAQACQPLLQWLVDTLEPRLIVALGRDAQRSLIESKVEVIAVRHPSYGGQATFIADVERIYGISRISNPAKSHQLL